MKTIFYLFVVILLLFYSNKQQQAIAKQLVSKEKPKKSKKKKADSNIESAVIFEPPKTIIENNNETLNSETASENTIEITQAPFSEEKTTTAIEPTEEFLTPSEKIAATTSFSNITNADIPDSYTLQAGENLYSVARKYNIPVAQLILLNNLNSTELKEGQKIILSGKPTPTATVNNTNSAKAKKENTVSEKNNSTIENRKPLNDDDRMASQTILIGCYAVANEADARNKVSFIKQKGIDAGYFFIPDYEPDGKKLFRVYAGPYANLNAAKQALAEIKNFREHAYIFKTK